MKLNHFIHAMILDIIRQIVGITIKIHSKHPQVNKGVQRIDTKNSNEKVLKVEF